MAIGAMLAEPALRPRDRASWSPSARRCCCRRCCGTTTSRRCCCPRRFLAQRGRWWGLALPLLALAAGPMTPLLALAATLLPFVVRRPAWTAAIGHGGRAADATERADAAGGVGAPAPEPGRRWPTAGSGAGLRLETDGVTDLTARARSTAPAGSSTTPAAPVTGITRPRHGRQARAARDDPAGRRPHRARPRTGRRWESA